LRSSISLAERVGRARVERRLAGMTPFTEVQREDAFAHASAVVMLSTLQVGTAGTTGRG
jgi:hypothetical protein